MSHLPERDRSRFTLGARLASFRYAAQGLAFMVRHQHNAWLHLLVAVTVCAAGWALGVSASDWRWLIVAMAMVLMAEAFNTAVEHVCDVVSPQYAEAVKIAKDVGAGAVLIAAVGAALMGVLTFWPYMQQGLA
jgi:diacylglycerol kinase (ATP)